MQSKEEFQSELFEEFDKQSKKKHVRKGQPIAKGYSILLHVSHEQLVFFVIALILSSVLIFSLGVERGKRLPLPEEEIAIIPREINIEVEELTPESVNEELVEAPQPQVEPKLEELIKTAEPVKVVKEISRPYTVQVATYWSKPNASKEMEGLRRLGMQPFIIATNGKYEVCVGEYINKDEAKISIKKLKKKYKDCFLRKR